MVAILLLAGLFVAGVFAVVYATGLFGYRILALPVAGKIEAFARDVEGGTLPPLVVAALVAVAVIGLVLLVAELKPRTPRRVRMGRGTYVTRGVVEKNAAEAAAGAFPGVLESSARARARRRPGARVDLEARVRRGEGEKGLGRVMRDRVAGQLSQRGVPVGRLKAKVVEVDPRRTKVRVR